MDIKEVFENTENILTGSKKQYFSLKMIDCLPAIDFGVEYLIENEKATVIIYDFDIDDKFNVRSCLGLINSFIHHKFLVEHVFCSVDIQYFYRIMREHTPDNETAFIDPGVYYGKKIDGIYFTQFSGADFTWLDNKDTNLDDVNQAIKYSHSKFIMKPAYRYTPQYQRDIKEIEEEEQYQSSRNELRNNIKILQGTK